MSNSPRARSASRAFSARAVAEATPNSTEWNSWFSPWFTALDDALSVSSEQTARDSFFSRRGSLAPTAIIQSTEAEERLQFSRTHLAREAHKRKRYQSTRATSEDVTMACGSPTPTVRESTEFLQKTPASWRLSATKSASVMPPLTPFSKSLSPGPIFDHEFVTNATTFSDGHDGLRSPAQFSGASRIFQSYQPRDTSRVSEVPSLSHSSTDRYSISPAAHSNGSSRESRPPFPGPSSPGLACDLQLGENMASLFGNAEKCGSSPVPSRNCSPLARDATRVGSGGSTSDVLPREALSQPDQNSRHLLSSLDDNIAQNLGARGQSDRGASKFLRELRSRIANGPPGASQSLICDRWVQERTIGLLRYHREIIPNLWDEDDAMFESRHLDRDAAYTFCYGTAKEEMLHELERMSSRDSNRSHKSSPSTRDIVPSAVVISSVDGHEDEPRSSRAVHQLPEAIVFSDRKMERGGGSALEASSFHREPVPRGQPTAARVHQRAWSRPQQQAQSLAQQRARSRARQRAKKRTRERARSMARQMDSAVSRIDKYLIVGRDPAYDYLANRPVHEQRWRTCRRYTPNTRRLREDERLIRGLSPTTRYRRSKSQARMEHVSGRR